jgi:DNA polymerase-1
MKPCTLALVFGTTVKGLAQQLKVPEQQAATILRRFQAMVPRLMAAQHRQRELPAIRGYATSVAGLRRYRHRRGTLDFKQRNWLSNHPVRATAADIFKLAGIRLDCICPDNGASLVMTFHDAFIFETPLKRLTEVAELTGRVMIEAVQDYFPELRPRVELNISQPLCWNKDGRTESLEKWLADN